MIRLVRPSRGLLSGYVAALRAGWSPDNLRRDAAEEELAAIAADAEGFLASLDDPEARGGPILQPDGSFTPRLPGFRRWMEEDGAFLGSIGLRWVPGTGDLPPRVPGHAGYAVVPLARGRGVATAALGLLLHEARAVGLPWVTLTTDPGNLASQRVILRNGGVALGRFEKPAAHGGGEGLRFRIVLGPPAVTPAAAIG